MKTNLGKGVGIKSNATGQKQIKVRMNEDVAMALVTKNLYGNPIQTLTQEYLCNGRDAQRAANRPTVAIDVTLPTQIDSVLRIRDYGDGIDEDNMVNVFCVLGESSKNQSNDQTGGFGIGAKSGWAYSDSFIVRSICKDGKKTFSTTYLAHMGSGKGGSLDQISREETTEPTGVEIQINVKEKDISLFHKAVFRATQFWDVKPNIKGLLDQEIPSLWKEKKVLFSGETWAVYNNDQLDSNVIGEGYNIIFLIDGIPYRLDNTISSKAIQMFKPSRDVNDFYSNRNNANNHLMNHNVTLAINVGNGEVEVNPNRENINYNDYSKNQIDQVLVNTHAVISKHIKSEIASVKTAKSLLDVQSKLREGFTIREELEKEFKNVCYTLDSSLAMTVEVQDQSNSKEYVRLEFDVYQITTNRARKQILSKEESKYISFSGVDITFLTKDTDEGPVLVREKVRSLFSLTEKDSVWRKQRVYVLKGVPVGGDEKGFKAAVKEFDCKTISSIVMPEKIRAASTRTSSKGKIVLHMLTQGHGTQILDNIKYVTEDEVKTEKYAYILEDEGYQLPLCQDKKIDTGRYDLPYVIGFLNRRNIKVCSVTKTQLKKVEALKNFVSFDKIVSTGKGIDLTAAEEDSIRYESWGSIPSWITRRSVSLLEDPLIKKVFEFDEKAKNNRATRNLNFTRIPGSIQKIFEKKVQDLKKEQVEMSSHAEKISNRYPLLVYSREEFSADIALYVNAKYQDLVKNKKLK